MWSLGNHLFQPQLKFYGLKIASFRLALGYVLCFNSIQRPPFSSPCKGSFWGYMMQLYSLPTHLLPCGYVARHPTHKHTSRLWLFSDCRRHKNIPNPIFNQAPLLTCVQREPGCVKRHRKDGGLA